ncbi:MAG: DOMON-like domain-containing protein, partial [Rhodocyclaceae bacterium]
MAQAIHATLAGHPDNPQGYVERVGVTLLSRPDGSLRLSYTIQGPTASMRIPTRDVPAPGEALWQTTCCELFVATDATSAYREFNFSPSGQWAVFDFAAYRQPTNGTTPPAPRVLVRCQEDALRVDVHLLPSALPAGRHLRCAATVVVARYDGRLGHWALAHPDGRPDFHHPAG